MLNLIAGVFVILIFFGWVSSVTRAAAHGAYFVQKKYKKFVEEQERKQEGGHHDQSSEKTYSGSENKSISDDELKTLYHKLVRKYHPDFATNSEDKEFRTFLTAKINGAYKAKDVKLLRLFD